MLVDVDPLKSDDVMYVEPVDYIVVDAIVDVVENLSVEADCKVVEATEGPKISTEIFYDSQFSEKMKVSFPMIEEELIDLLNRCKLNNYEVMLCPRCSAVYDKEGTKGLENYRS